MILRLTILTFFVFSLAATSSGQQAKLEGYVVNINGKPVPNTRITVTGGQAAVTDGKGHFAIGFPQSVRPGLPVRLAVVKPNWVIYQPMLGIYPTQDAGRNYEPLRVVIVPKGSPLALSPED